MNNYDSNAFIEAFQRKVKQRISCPICGCDKFSTNDNFASIITGKDMDTIKLGTSVPCGMLFCENCGHIEFFALGVLLAQDDE